jgi:hypothetical protein
MMCRLASYKKKIMKQKIFFCILKSMKKEVGSVDESGSGSISQRHGYVDPDPYQNVTDPHHCTVLYMLDIPRNCMILSSRWRSSSPLNRKVNRFPLSPTRLHVTESQKFKLFYLNIFSPEQQLLFLCNRGLQVSMLVL